MGVSVRTEVGSRPCFMGARIPRTAGDGEGGGGRGLDSQFRCGDQSLVGSIGD